MGGMGIVGKLIDAVSIVGYDAGRYLKYLADNIFIRVFVLPEKKFVRRKNKHKDNLS